MIKVVKNIEDLIAESKVCFIQEQYREALNLAEKAIELDSKNADAHQCAGNAYMSLKKYDLAIEHYKTAAECDFDNGDRYFHLGYAYAASNQPVKALSMFAKADETGCSPNVTGQLYKIIGMLCFDMQKYEDAVLNLIKAEEIIGIDMDILQRKALSYGMIGDTSSAIEIANQIKIVAPTSYLGYRIAFNILLQENRLDEAAKELDRAERFAKLNSELFFDWISYETSQFKIDGNKEHLYHAIEKINDSLCVLPPNVYEVIDSYINAAEIYVELENADMALNCLVAAENPISSYNKGFSVKEIEPIPTKPVVRPNDAQINARIQEIRRKYGDRRLENIRNDMIRRNRQNHSDSDNMTPQNTEQELKENVVRLDNNTEVVYSPEKSDQIYRLYVAACTLKKDTAHIKVYASKLAKSSDLHSKYIGRYSLAKALKDEGYANMKEEYQDLLRFLSNEMIKDPSDLLALSFRVQCYIDLGEFDEAEKLCKVLSDDIRKPLEKKINEARSGGDT